MSWDPLRLPSLQNQRADSSYLHSQSGFSSLIHFLFTFSAFTAGLPFKSKTGQRKWKLFSNHHHQGHKPPTGSQSPAIKTQKLFTTAKNYFRASGKALRCRYYLHWDSFYPPRTKLKNLKPPIKGCRRQTSATLPIIFNKPAGKLYATTLPAHSSVYHLG